MALTGGEEWRSRCARVLRRGAWAALVVMCAGALVACGDDGGSGGTAENNGGTNNTSTSTNSGTTSTNSGTTSTNNSTNVTERPFPIAYVARNRSEIPGTPPGGPLLIADSENLEDTIQVSPGDLPCHVGCTVSDDLQWFVWITDDGTRALKVAPITGIGWDGATVDTGSEQTLATNVLTYQVGGNVVAYLTETFNVFVGALGGSMNDLGTVGNEGLTGGFYLHPEGKGVITWILPNLVAMELSSVTLEGGNPSGPPEPVALFESTGFGGTGSFYGSNEKMAWSPDMRFLAVVTRGLTDSDPCETGADCLQNQTCGANNRCTEQRLVVNMVDMDNRDKLGEACESPAACGAAHLCDFADPADPTTGVCLPGRLDLGPSGPNDCERRRGEEYTKMRDALSWSPDSNILYMLAVEDCSRFDIPRASILATGPGLNEPSPVITNPGLDFSGESCYDFDEEEFTVESDECVVDIDTFALSRDGNTVVFSASSPRAENNFELYTIDRLGSRGKRWLTDELESVVTQLKPLEDL